MKRWLIQDRLKSSICWDQDSFQPISVHYSTKWWHNYRAGLPRDSLGAGSNLQATLQENVNPAYTKQGVGREIGQLHDIQNMNSFLEICRCLPDKTDFETQRRLNRVEVNATQHSVAFPPLQHSHVYLIYHYHLLFMENKPTTSKAGEYPYLIIFWHCNSWFSRHKSCVYINTKNGNFTP